MVWELCFCACTLDYMFLDWIICLGWLICNAINVSYGICSSLLKHCFFGYIYAFRNLLPLIFFLEETLIWSTIKKLRQTEQ